MNNKIFESEHEKFDSDHEQHEYLDPWSGVAQGWEFHKKWTSIHCLVDSKVRIWIIVKISFVTCLLNKLWCIYLMIL